MILAWLLKVALSFTVLWVAFALKREPEDRHVEGIKAAVVAVVVQLVGIPIDELSGDFIFSRPKFEFALWLAAWIGAIKLAFDPEFRTAVAVASIGAFLSELVALLS